MAIQDQRDGAGFDFSTSVDRLVGASENLKKAAKEAVHCYEEFLLADKDGDNAMRKKMSTGFNEKYNNFLAERKKMGRAGIGSDFDAVEDRLIDMKLEIEGSMKNPVPLHDRTLNLPMRPDRAKLAVQAAQPESPPADIKETAKIGAIAAMELNFSTLKHDAEVRVSAGKATGIKLSPFVFAERAWNIISTVITSDEVSSSNHVRDEAIKKIKTFITDAERTDKGLGEAVMAEVLRQDRKLHIELSA